MKARKSGSRHTLLLYKRVMDRLWWYTLVLGLLLFAIWFWTWWYGSSLIHAQQDLWLLLGAAVVLGFTLFAFFALGVLAGRGVARAFEMHVTLSSGASLTKQKFLMISYQIGQQIHCGSRSGGCRLLIRRVWDELRKFRFVGRILGAYVFRLVLFNSQTPVRLGPGNGRPARTRTRQLVHNRSNRDFYDFIGRIFAVHLFPATVSAIFRLNNRFIEKVSQMVGMLIGSKDNVAAPPAVASIGPALGHKFLTSKADTPAPAFSRLRKNFDAIDKH